MLLLFQLQAVDTKGATMMGPDREVMFEGEEFTLDVSKEGIMLESEWTITPPANPVVSLY